MLYNIQTLPPRDTAGRYRRRSPPEDIANVLRRDMICNICNKSVDDLAYIARRPIGIIGECCLNVPTLADIDAIARPIRDRTRINSVIDTRNWYLITLTSEIGHQDAVPVLKATLTKFYKSKMFKGEKYHSWEINEHGMIHVHIIFITSTYCPHKDKLAHKWFIDITKLKHKQFNYLVKKLDDSYHIEFKKTNQLTDNLPKDAVYKVKEDVQEEADDAEAVGGDVEV